MSLVVVDIYEHTLVELSACGHVMSYTGIIERGSNHVMLDIVDQLGS
jgi:hypothetical protein